MADGILNELWGDRASELPKVDFGEPYGIGTWRDAVLMDVETVDGHEFGYRVKLVLNLKGEEGMKYTGTLNFPKTVERNGDVEAHERHLAREDRIRNNVAGILLGAGLLGGVIPNIDNDEEYAFLVNVFRHGIGNNMPVRVKRSRKFDKETETWVDTDFTELVCIRARKKK